MAPHCGCDGGFGNGCTGDYDVYNNGIHNRDLGSWILRSQLLQVLQVLKLLEYDMTDSSSSVRIISHHVGMPYTTKACDSNAELHSITQVIHISFVHQQP